MPAPDRPHPDEPSWPCGRAVEAILTMRYKAPAQAAAKGAAVSEARMGRDASYREAVRECLGAQHPHRARTMLDWARARGDQWDPTR